MAGDTGEYCQRDANSHIKNMREDRGDVSSSARLRTEKRLGEAGMNFNIQNNLQAILHLLGTEIY